MSNEQIAASGLAGLLEQIWTTLLIFPRSSTPAGYTSWRYHRPEEINDKEQLNSTTLCAKCWSWLMLARLTNCRHQVQRSLPDTNEIGRGKLKAAAKPVMEALGTTSFADILGNQVQGMEVFATLKRRVHKDDKAWLKASKGLP